MVQLPIGSAESFCGVIDLLRMQALLYTQDTPGATFQITDIPAASVAQAREYHLRLIEELAEFDEDILEKYLGEEPVPAALLVCAIRRGTMRSQITPVLCGAAFRNKGVQPLLDAIVDYLPSPVDVPAITGMAVGADTPVARHASDDAPCAVLAFKVMVDPYVGHLVFVRVYAGVLETGSVVYNPARDRWERIGRLVRMHTYKREEVREIRAGDIGAVIGLKHTVTGDTLCDEAHQMVLESMTFPAPVMAVAIAPGTKADADKLTVSLHKMSQEAPTFRVHTDEDTGQTIIAGMGELHLDILVDRLAREFHVGAEVSRPQVAYKETLRRQAEGEGKFVRQSVQFAVYDEVPAGKYASILASQRATSG